MIDTHTHIYLEHFEEDRESMLKRAADAGVDEMFLPNIDKHSIQNLKNLAVAHTNIYPMMGLHPGSVKADYKEQLDIILKELDSNTKYYAVGEIGIDLYWDKSFVEAQKEVFGIQIEKAKDMALPIVIHCRDAFNEVFEVLEKHFDDRLFGIFHCFTGNVEQAKRAIDLNLKLGIGGVVTFKNGGLDKVIEKIDLKHLVLETDAPFLAPAPHRGKRNEPAYLKLIAEKIATLHQISLTEVDRISTQNAHKIFKP